MPGEMAGQRASVLDVAARTLARAHVAESWGLRARGDGTPGPGRTAAAVGTPAEAAGAGPGSRTGRMRPGTKSRAADPAERAEAGRLVAGGGLHYLTGQRRRREFAPQVPYPWALAGPVPGAGGRCPLMEVVEQAASGRPPGTSSTRAREVAVPQ